jgi:AhpD family alkylhydroperoxidase
MIQDWQELINGLNAEIMKLRSGTSDVMKSFSAMAQSSLKTNALDTKTKELMALAIGVATRCDDCIAFHTKAAVKAGYMGAGPSVMYASHVISAFDQFQTEKTAKPAPPPQD